MATEPERTEPGNAEHEGTGHGGAGERGAGDGGAGTRDAERVAVLGTGIMGAAMARNLLAAGLPTTVWDRSAAVTAPLRQAGATVAASAADAARDAGLVITMLPTADVVTSVVFDGGVAEALARGAVWAQMGTIGLTATVEIGARLRQARPDVLFVEIGRAHV